MKKELLAKLKMPKKPMAESEADMDLAMLDVAEEGEEMPADDQSDTPEPEMESGELDMFSDEEILKEMERRGLKGSVAASKPGMITGNQ